MAHVKTPSPPPPLDDRAGSSGVELLRPRDRQLDVAKKAEGRRPVAGINRINLARRQKKEGKGS